MAVFLPTIEQIQHLKVPPTNGEWALLFFLRNALDDSYEVYFNPYLNGDRPDVIIMRRGYGVLVIEVKDWNLDHFEIDNKKRWVFKQNQAIVKSPISQVYKYKQNLFDLHIPSLLELSINDIKAFNMVSCAVYFHCVKQKDLIAKLITPFEQDRKYRDFLKYNIDLLGVDGLNQDNFTEILRKRFLSRKRKENLFTPQLYENFRRILAPPLHIKAQGEPYHYSNKQKEIIYSDILEQRVKGVFGSGKTTVLAARAVQAYKRALSRNPDPKILILTFNITLKNYIHDKLQRVEESFPIQNFIIVNYHNFINGEMNNLGIDFHIPQDLHESKDRRALHDYLDKHYYSNTGLFEEFKKQIRPYDAVLIDEIQDYKREWMEIIKHYFRHPQGDYVLFGDVKQNIYSMPVGHKDVITNVFGRPKELKYCYRSDYKIREVAFAFQRSRFQGKYEIDEIEKENEDGTLDLIPEKEGYINYMYIDEKENAISTLYTIVRGNILNKEKHISPNDITILGYRISLLRLFDLFYRYESREKVNSMLETVESMYMKNLNLFSGNSIPTWFARFIELSIKPELRVAWQNKHLDSKIINNKRRCLSRLLAVYELYDSFPGRFETALQVECDKSGLTKANFMDFMVSYKDDLDSFKQNVYNADYNGIRENKKMNFWMNSGTIKVSTISSFKGWESELVFLIIEPRYLNDTSFNNAFDELLYTGITRSRRDLVILNFGNKEYDSFMKSIIEENK